MLRHPDNSNLHLLYEGCFEGLPLQLDKVPFVREYLYKLKQAVDHALSQYPRVFAFRFDLRLPQEIWIPESGRSNVLMERFIESFKAKINHNRKLARVLNKYAHLSSVRYVWAREHGASGKPHYHVAVFLNKDAFNALGKYEAGRSNIFNYLEGAWASALKLPVSVVAGLVEIPRNATYFLSRDDVDGRNKFFYRASYLCKSATKYFGDGKHGFGSSRG